MPPNSEPDGPPGGFTPPGPPPNFQPPLPAQPFPSVQQPPYQSPPPQPQPGYEPGYEPPYQPPGGHQAAAGHQQAPFQYPTQPQSGYQQPGYPYGFKPPDHPSASTALVLGILAVAAGLFCWIPFLLGPFAWVTGSRAVADIDAAPAQWGGRDKARAGQILGIIATVFVGLFVLMILFFIFLISLGSL